MRKGILLSLLVLSLLFVPKINKAQTIYFCESVKENGEMVHPSTTFAMTKKGGILNMLVKLDEKIGAEKITYKVYRVSDSGDQSIDQTFDDKVTPEWLWFYHELILRSPGNYMVYVYPEGSTRSIASGLVHVIAAK